ncbi:hypothetical protein [Bradyrhizobium japonicum]|uniref:hypothetical protein n=1 Tax=Bradyrhizobium japonicum TaxID=375 RepID=UPI0004B1C459|nr:hypothetical protein [Bradyrhizobium japonicum]
MRADGDLVITLVHGTWPRNVWRDVFLTAFYGKWPTRSFSRSLWFADGSEFRNRLSAELSKRGLSARISPFLWSGANSVRERDKAAQELAEHIRAKQLDHPGSIQVLIAHSHGGNVALRALDQPGVTGDEIFITTIATPFVEILPTKLLPAETLRIDVMVSLTTSVLIPHYAIAINNAYFPTLNPNVLSLIVALVCVLPFMLFFGLRARNTRTVDELVGLTSLSPSVRKHPLLVLRAVDDEAALTLAAATIGNRFSRLLERSSYKISVLIGFLFISLVVFILVLIAISIFWSLDDFMASASAFMTRFLGFLQPVSDFMAWAFKTRFLQFLQPAFSFEGFPAFARGLVLAFFAFLFLPGVFNSAYGRELLPIFQGCEINSQSAPDSIERQSEFQSESTSTNWGMVVTLHQEEARRGLRHGLYDHPQCAERIAGWLQSELASRAI